MEDPLKEDNSFLGCGWSFPPLFFKKEDHGVDTGVVMVDREEDIRQSLIILLSTTKGERIMRPGYGASMDDLLFEPLSVSFAKRMSEKLERAILFYEPRIKSDDISFRMNTMQGVVEVKIDYTIIATNNRRNIVYPYYKIEATDLTL
jgi:phage baseplate assembly protein W